MWINVNVRLPKEGVFPVMGYNKSWIDLDFNPKGQRECFMYGYMNGKEWVSAKWNNDQDCWETDDASIPTHWFEVPECCEEDNW